MQVYDLIYSDFILYQYGLFDVFHFYLWLSWFWTKLSSLFVMPVKEKQLSCNNLIDNSFWYIFEVSLLFVLAFRGWIFEEILWIPSIVSLYLMYIAEDKKIKFISNMFSWPNYNDCYAFIRACATNRAPLFAHVVPIEVRWVW